jgi:hypothetical protein
MSLYQSFGQALRPTLATFAAFYPVQVLLTALVGLILFRVLYPKLVQWVPLPARDDVILLGTWMLLGPILIFVLARISSYMLFATRYLIYALPPFFVLLAWGVRQLTAERARITVVFAIALSAALYVPQLRMNEWRTPLASIASVAGENTPVLLRSGVVQSAVLDWKSEPQPDSYLFAALTAYPVPNEIIPVPFFVNRDAELYLEQEIQRRAALHERFCLIAEPNSDVLDTLPRWFERQGYSAQTHEAGGFLLTVFERTLQAGRRVN